MISFNGINDSYMSLRVRALARENECSRQVYIRRFYESIMLYLVLGSPSTHAATEVLLFSLKFQLYWKCNLAHYLSTGGSYFYFSV